VGKITANIKKERAKSRLKQVVQWF